VAIVSDSDDALLAGLDVQRERSLEWVQIDLAAAVGAPELAAALGPLWATFGPRRWWYVRKDPGLRVRIEVGAGAGAGSEAETLRRSTRAALAALGPVHVTTYEPETYRFGGPDGMDVAHDHFALDSALNAVAGRATPPLDPVEWSTAALGDLVARVVDDHAELWDAWKRLEELVGVGPAPARPQPGGGAGGSGPRRLLPVLQRGNAQVASRLRRVTLGHGVGPRGWFAAVAVFHWNRLGFDPVRMGEVVARSLRPLGGPR
jgi:hypothetical protein